MPMQRCAAAAATQGGTMQLTSPAFENNGDIPEVYSFEEGDGINPELRIKGVPAGARSLVLLMNDIDAPGGFTHWIVFNIPPSTAVIARDSIPGVQGRSDAKRKNYAGPRPPSGSHRYSFTVYALDTLLSAPEGEPKESVLKSMDGRILDQATLTGSYSREKKPAAV